MSARRARSRSGCRPTRRRSGNRSASPAWSPRPCSMVFVTTETEAEALLLEANLHQAAQAALQRAAARRQELPLYPHRRRPRGAAADQASRRALDPRRLFRPLRQRRRGDAHAQRAAARVPAAHLLRQLLRQPHAAVPAVPDQALLGALHRRDRAGRLRRAGRRGARLPLRPQPRDPPAARARDDATRPRRSTSRRRRGCATASRRCRRSRASRASIRARCRRPTSSPSPRRRGSSASRRSSSAPIRTGATAPISRAPTARSSAAEVLDSFLAQFYLERPAPRLVLLSHDVASRAHPVRDPLRARRPSHRHRRAAARREEGAGRQRAAQRARGAVAQARRGGEPGEAARRARRRLRPRGDAARGSRSTTIRTSWGPTRSAR